MNASRHVIEGCAIATDALWRVDGLGRAGIPDPVAALAYGPAPRVELLLVGGRPIVRGAELRTADEEGIAREIAGATRRLAEEVAL